MGETSGIAAAAADFLAVAPALSGYLEQLRAQLDELTNRFRVCEAQAKRIVLAEDLHGPWSAERLALVAGRADGMRRADLLAELNALPGRPLTIKGLNNRIAKMKLEKRPQAPSPAPAAAAPVQAPVAPPAPAEQPVAAAAAPSPPRRGRLEWTPSKIETVKRMRDEKMSAIEIAAALGMSKGQVCGALYRMTQAKGARTVVSAAPATAAPAESQPTLKPVSKPLSSDRKPQARPAKAPPPKVEVVEDTEVQFYARKHGIGASIENVNLHRRRAGLPEFVIGERVIASVAREWAIRSGMPANAPIFAINGQRRAMGRKVFIVAGEAL